MLRFLRAVRLAAPLLALAGLAAAAPAAAEDGQPAPAAQVVTAAAAVPLVRGPQVRPVVNPAFLIAARPAPPLLDLPPVASPRGPTPLLNADRARFASLEDAIAAHYGTNAGANEAGSDAAARCLAGAVFFESKGEPLSGQLAVAQVVVNRAKSGRFAPDVCGVVKQRGQFSFVRGGEIPAVDEGRPAWRIALAIARVALADAWEGVAPKALYFHARAIGIGSGVRVASIGNHVFFR